MPRFNQLLASGVAVLLLSTGVVGSSPAWAVDPASPTSLSIPKAPGYGAISVAGYGTSVHGYHVQPKPKADTEDEDALTEVVGASHAKKLAAVAPAAVRKRSLYRLRDDSGLVWTFDPGTGMYQNELTGHTQYQAPPSHSQIDGTNSSPANGSTSYGLRSGAPPQ
jgi:hypothetical protein